MPDPVVVVTGGAPYASDIDYNSSQKVRDAMPDEIQRPGKPTIRIHKFPEDIGCVYNECRDLIPRIWSTDPAAYNGQPPPHSTSRTSSSSSPPFHIDLVVHFGMRRRDNHIAFETLARKNVFDTPGLDGVPQGNGDEERWRGVPDVLRPAFDLHAAAAEVAKRHPDIKTRTSDDAGAYFCEYQLYSSLAYLHKRGEVARVVFMHVPKEIDEQTLRNDTAVAQTLIAALVDQDVEGRFKAQV